MYDKRQSLHLSNLWTKKKKRLAASNANKLNTWASQKANIINRNEL